MLINNVFGPNVPAVRSSNGVLTQYLWRTQGANWVLECFLENFGGGGTATCGVFFRRNSSSEEYFQVLLETASDASDSTLRLQFVGAGSVNITVTLVRKTNGIVRVEFSGSAIKIFFDEVPKISTTSGLVQSDVGMGLVKVTTDGSRPSEWETLGFVDGAEITSNGDTETGVTTPPGASGLVAVVVTNPGGETIVVRTCSNRYCYSSRQIPRTLVVQAFTVFTFTLLGVVRLPTKSEDL